MKPLERTWDEESVYRKFAGASLYYDLWANLTETRAQQLSLEWAGLEGNSNVLEVATGTGLFFEKLVKCNTGGYTAGIDFSREMLARTKKRIRPYLKNNYIDLKLESVYDMEFRHGRFDYIFNNYMLDLFPEADFIPILEKYNCLLKKEGKLLICSMAFPEKWYQRPWYKMAKSYPDLLAGCRPVSLHQYLEKAGYKVLKKSIVSQATFPSEVLMAIKT